jgi:hypothetical protein
MAQRLKTVLFVQSKELIPLEIELRPMEFAKA